MSWLKAVTFCLYTKSTLANESFEGDDDFKVLLEQNHEFHQNPGFQHLVVGRYSMEICQNFVQDRHVDRSIRSSSNLLLFEITRDGDLNEFANDIYR